MYDRSNTNKVDFDSGDSRRSNFGAFVHVMEEVKIIECTAFRGKACGHLMARNTYEKHGGFCNECRNE